MRQAGQARDGRGRMRQAGQARAAGRKARSVMPRVAYRCRMAQSPFGRTAGRCRGKAARRWQHLRAVRDFGFPDAKEGPWRQDSRAMHPESPDCAREWMHGARMLPGRGPFSRIRRKRDACGAILASQGPGADATREGDAGGGGRRARWGGAMRAGLPDGNDLDDDSGSARWRHRGTRAAGSSA